MNDTRPESTLLDAGFCSRDHREQCLDGIRVAGLVPMDPVGRISDLLNFIDRVRPGRSAEAVVELYRQYQATHYGWPAGLDRMTDDQLCGLLRRGASGMTEYYDLDRERIRRGLPEQLIAQERG